MELESEVSWFLQSNQRPSGNPINNFPLSIPPHLVPVLENQKISYKLAAFNIPNSFYNISSQNNTFNFKYTGLAINVVIQPGFYTSYTAIIAAVNTALTSYSIPFTFGQDSTTLLAKWTPTGALTNNPLQFIFPTGRNLHQLLGMDDGQSSIYINGTLGYAPSPYPMMYNNLQNINLRAYFTSNNNLEYRNETQSLGFSQLFAKIPYQNTAPGLNIHYNPADTDQFIVFSRDTHTPPTEITFQITDDYQNLLDCAYDWEAVIKIQIWNMPKPSTVETKLEDVMLMLHDLEKIFLGEPIGGESAPRSVFISAKDIMERAFLTSRGLSVFVTEKGLLGGGSIADEMSFLQNHFAVGGNISNELAALTGATGLGAITDGMTSLANSVTNSFRAVEDTIDAVKEGVDAVNQLATSVKETADSVNNVVTTVKDIVTEVRKVEEEVLIVENEVKTAIDTVNEVLVSHIKDVDGLYSTVQDILANDRAESDVNRENLAKLGGNVNNILKLNAETVQVISDQIVKDRETVQVISDQIVKDRETVQVISDQVDLFGSFIKVIKNGLDQIASILIGKPKKITYYDEIHEVKSLKSEDEAKAWAQINSNLQFDSQNGDSHSWNSLIEAARKVKGLESWVSQRGEI